MSLDTKDATYTRRLVEKETSWWKAILDVQRPYRWNLKRLNLGHVLEVGCGNGRNLKNLDGNAVGVDHNENSVATAKQRGYEAYTAGDFCSKFKVGDRIFDSLLFAHVVEHMTPLQAELLIKEYLPYVRKGGKVVLITPQEAGYKSDPTHVAFCDLSTLSTIGKNLGLLELSIFSFPFPRIFGRWFKYNEFVYVGLKKE